MKKIFLIPFLTVSVSWQLGGQSSHTHPNFDYGQSIQVNFG
jgi:hypothetical protein